MVAGQDSKSRIYVSDAPRARIIIRIFAEEQMFSKMNSHLNVLTQNAKKFLSGRVLVPHIPVYLNWVNMR